MLPLIGAFKLAKGLLILAVALGVLHLVRGDPADTLAHWASELHIDPEGRHFTRAVDRILSLDARRLKALSAGMFVYAGLFLVEGVGLIRGRRSTPIRAAALLVNLAIVWYLVARLRRAEERPVAT